jgi:predicted ATPase
MRYVYLDNFRGFSEATIPLLDVNFLVGENSTGKTSLLMMLQMFSGPQLFMQSEYTNDGVHRGHFEEMIGVHSDDKSYFRSGYVSEQVRGKEKATGGILLTCQNSGGLSQISRLTTTMVDSEVHLRFEDKKVFYLIQKRRSPPTAKEMCHRLREWVGIHAAARNGGWTEIGPLPEEISRVPLMFLLAVAMSSSAGKSPNDVSLTLPAVAPPLVWIAPIRGTPRRTYDEPQAAFSPEGLHIPYVIKRMLGSEKEAEKFRDFIKRIGEASGLFERIEIKQFGNTETSPFEVDAYLDDAALAIGWLGYGVSQSLPIFVELLDRPAGSWFAIQQPEVHLHPKARACLGDVFFEMAVREQKKFIIETHSDFTIDRFRLNYRQTKSKKERNKFPRSQILFFQRKEKRNIVTPIHIGASGELPAEQPEEYRNFFIKEEMKILGL